MLQAPGVIVREFFQVSQCDPPGKIHVVVGHVRFRIFCSVLKFHEQVRAKLLKIYMARIDAEEISDALGLV
jgi:hypothetical protein